jgi:hypothetical protein
VHWAATPQENIFIRVIECEIEVEGVHPVVSRKLGVTN